MKIEDKAYLLSLVGGDIKAINIILGVVPPVVAKKVGTRVVHNEESRPMRERSTNWKLPKASNTGKYQLHYSIGGHLVRLGYRSAEEYTRLKWLILEEFAIDSDNVRTLKAFGDDKVAVTEYVKAVVAKM